MAKSCGNQWFPLWKDVHRSVSGGEHLVKKRKGAEAGIVIGNKSKSILKIVLVIDIIAIFLALSLGENPEQYFKEKAFITYLSFCQILAASGLAWGIFFISRNRSGVKSWRASHFVWAIIALGFIYLSLDEIGRFHEGMDKLVHKIFSIEETPFTDRLDDIIVAFYGLFGLGIIYFYRDEFKKYRETFPLLITGFILLGIMIILDIISNDITILLKLTSNTYIVNTSIQWLKAIEDVFKIFSEAVFIGALCRSVEIVKVLYPKRKIAVLSQVG